MRITHGRFALIGDVQRTSPIEFWRKSNVDEAMLLIRQIVDEAPDFLAIVGDLVFRGSSAADWAAFDQLAMPLYHAQVPVLPLLGNHDYWLNPQIALKHFFTRFPHLQNRHWFSTVYGPLGMIFLDSNVHQLPATRWQQQMAWYEDELARFEADPDVSGVLVLLHHPPFTNSVLVSDNLAVQRTFLPGFLQARKTLAMVAGHVHSYEHYVRGGKTFLVTGGGGPRSKLTTEARRRHVDERFDGPALRGFHFLLLEPTPEGLTVTVRGLEQAAALFKTWDAMLLPWA